LDLSERIPHDDLLAKLSESYDKCVDIAEELSAVAPADMSAADWASSNPKLCDGFNVDRFPRTITDSYSAFKNLCGWLQLLHHPKARAKYDFFPDHVYGYLVRCSERIYSQPGEFRLEVRIHGPTDLQRPVDEDPNFAGLPVKVLHIRHFKKHYRCFVGEDYYCPPVKSDRLAFFAFKELREQTRLVDFRRLEDRETLEEQLDVDFIFENNNHHDDDLVHIHKDIFTSEFRPLLPAELATADGICLVHSPGHTNLPHLGAVRVKSASDLSPDLPSPRDDKYVLIYVVPLVKLICGAVRMFSPRPAYY
jgi:hypothetical protein